MVEEEATGIVESGGLLWQWKRKHNSGTSVIRKFATPGAVRVCIVLAVA